MRAKVCPLPDDDLCFPNFPVVIRRYPSDEYPKGWYLAAFNGYVKYIQVGCMDMSLSNGTL